MQRSRRLVSLALNNEEAKPLQGSSSRDTPLNEAKKTGNTVQIIQEKTLVLDEKTGHFVFKICSPASVSQKQVLQNDCYSGESILDEKTGQIFPAKANSDVSFESDFSDSHSEYIPSYDYDTKSSSSSASFVEKSRILDEYSGTIKVKRARKGQGNKNNWARNRLNNKRMRGEEYASIKRQTNGEIVGVVNRKARKLQARCDSKKCAKKFSKKCDMISEIDRKMIFDAFWDLSWEERKTYVVAMVSIKPVTAQTKGHPSRRSNTLQYSLKVAGEILPVCKKMFCGTLCLGEWSVANWVKSVKSHSEIGMPKKDKKIKRIKAINIRKTEHIQNFLSFLPKMPSHYCRQSTNKEYVDVNYTTWAEVYCDFENYLKDQYISDEEKPTYKSFMDIIHKNNLSIYRPKKDQCDTCYGYKHKNVAEETYQEHIKDRDCAPKEKAEDKARCLRGEIQMITVDLQAVQSLPLISAGAQYFKLKLSVHQFTIYNEYDKSVVCYVWHKGEGGMEANVFASCLLNYLDRLDKNMPIFIYSDGCSAQNRNVTLSNALQHFALIHKAEIQQKYLVHHHHLHTQMECDSVHATIERKKKGKELYVPADFATVIKQARKSKPYEVCYLDHTFFYNYSILTYLKSIRPGSKKGDPCVVDVKALRYTSDMGTQYKLSFDKDWDLLPHRLTRQLASSADLTVPKLYNERLPITQRKYNDLQDIKQLIPVDYHSFYENLLYE